LQIIVLNKGAPIEQNHKWFIDMFGVKHSLRNVKDGVTYFGYSKDFFDCHTCDVNIPHIEEDVSEKQVGPHFKIEYKLALGSF